MKQRLVVIGCGLVGGAVVDAALKLDWPPPIVIVSRSIPDRFCDLRGVETYFGEIGSGVLEPVLRDDDVLVVASGAPDPRCRPADIERLLEPSARATTEIVKTCSRRWNVHVLHISSGGAVYGMRNDIANEATAVAPNSVYGAVKASEEVLLGTLRNKNRNRVTILRGSTVYGRRRNTFQGQGLVQLAIDASPSREPIQLFGNGLDRRGYLLDSDLGRVVIAMGSRSHLSHNVYNMCSGQVLTGLDVVRLVGEYTGAEPNVELVDGPSAHIVVDNARLLSELRGFEFVPFGVGIGELVAPAV